ncbi:TetR/AcrR family transcriptional regulator [Streptomyces melanosporofaciens]|uniref:Regulatory protein, tetR family n=1 Tax=Streptomyces melanosporofaciens TaxID=67327 RepID=A0A1H5CBD9_STRMJ|nr:TetR family transcriptional regulator [Streptomyces melanosporofaciens]SED64072.1 regulatory protein, tetR family [Streptomyces melanosporofaciens]
MTQQQKTIDAGAETRARLTEHAERLIAEQGYAAFSLRVLGAATGQRNKSVAQYHFGSREGLIEAIIVARSEGIDRRRAELLKLAQKPDELDVAELVRLAVQPLAESISPSPTGSYYLQFLAKIIDEPSLQEVWRRRSIPPRSYKKVLRLLRQQLRHLPRRVRERRLMWLQTTTLHLLADHERQRRAGTARVSETEEVVSDLVHMLTSLLESPTERAVQSDRT